MSMQGVETSESELRERLTAILCATPPLMRVLTVGRHLSLPDWLVFSGAVCECIDDRLYIEAPFGLADLFGVAPAAGSRPQDGRLRPDLCGCATPLA